MAPALASATWLACAMPVQHTHVDTYRNVRRAQFVGIAATGKTIVYDEMAIVRYERASLERGLP
jgi:hypothetical protein